LKFVPSAYKGLHLADIPLELTVHAKLETSYFFTEAKIFSTNKLPLVYSKW